MDIEEPVAPSEATESEAIVEQEQVEGEAAETPPEETDKEKSKSQERRERRQAHENRLREEAQAAEQRAREAEARAARILSAAKGEAEPKEADFPDLIQYAAAQAVWKQTQAAAQRQAQEVTEEADSHKKQAESIEAVRVQERHDAFLAAEDEARRRYADYDAVARNPRVPITPAVASLVLESDQPADVAYHLGKNPELAAALAKMPPLAAAREIGRIEATLTLPQPRLKTEAPEPIAPIRPRGTTVRDPEKLPMQEYIELRKAGKIR